MNRRVSPSLIARAAATFTCGVLAFGCSSEPAPVQRVGDQCIGGTSQTGIVSKLAFAREESKGVSEGFDVDGIVSDAEQSDEDRLRTCKQADYVDPEGRKGIDNQMAKLLPLLEGVTSADLNVILKGAIDNGQLLTTVTLDGVDDLEDDPCVAITFKAASGTPTKGTDGELDPSQTFEHDTTGPVSRTVGRIRRGIFEAGPFDLKLLVVVFAEKFVLDLQRARVRMTLDRDERGRFRGVIGGAVRYKDFYDIVQEFDINEQQKSGALGILRLLGDLENDGSGNCTSISLGATMAGRRAFLVPGAEPVDAGTDSGAKPDAATADAGPVSEDEAAWSAEVLPIAKESCFQCHGGGSPARRNLTTYGAWKQDRALIRQLVITDQRMPPATVPLTDARRRTLDAWLKREP